MITKWIWTFGGDSEHAKKYVVINGNEIDGRNYVFAKYGKDNMCMDYPYEYGMKEVVEKYGYELLEEVTV